MTKSTAALIQLACVVAGCSSQETGSASGQLSSDDSKEGGLPNTNQEQGNGEQVDQPPPPCHPNPNAAADVATVAQRGDIAPLPPRLKSRLLRLAGRPHTYPPLQVFAEADSPSLVFQYNLLDTRGFEPNVFTKVFPGVNDKVLPT